MLAGIVLLAGFAFSWQLQNSPDTHVLTNAYLTKWIAENHASQLDDSRIESLRAAWTKASEAASIRNQAQQRSLSVSNSLVIGSIVLFMALFLKLREGC